MDFTQNGAGDCSMKKINKNPQKSPAYWRKKKEEYTEVKYCILRREGFTAEEALKEARKKADDIFGPVELIDSSVTQIEMF